MSAQITIYMRWRAFGRMPSQCGGAALNMWRFRENVNRRSHLPLARKSIFVGTTKHCICRQNEWAGGFFHGAGEAAA